MATLIVTGFGFDKTVLAATMTETGFAVPANVHRGNGSALNAPSGGGMPATVAEFLASRGHGPATIDSLRQSQQLPLGKTGGSVLNFGQEVQSLAVFGTRARAIFDASGALTTLSENLAPAGPVRAATIDERVALDAALDEVQPGVAVTLSERGSSANSVRFGGDDSFFQDPTVTRVAIPGPGGSLREGFLVMTWADRLHYTLVDGDGNVLNVENRTNNDSYNIFARDPDGSGQAVVSGPGAGNTESPIGWLTGSQTTLQISGNNVSAFLDRDANDISDGGGDPVGDGNFTTNADLSANPTAADNQEVAVQNLFYLNNIIHDELYRHGFTEAARNFQDDNFNKGGVGGDEVLAHAQDGYDVNNAFFTTPIDGGHGLMEMFLWNIDATSSHVVTGEFDAGHGGGERYLAGAAEFGPALDTTGMTGATVIVDDGIGVTSDGCEAIVNSAQVAGKIAVLDRGGCAFEDKVENAAAALAIGAIVVNNDGDEIFFMSGSKSVNISSVFVGQSNGEKIKAASGATATAALNTTAQKDGDLDADIVWHEFGHGLSWRMIGNMYGVMGGAIGEAFGDALAHGGTTNFEPHARDG